MQFLFISSFATLALAGSIPALFERQTTCSNGGSVCGSSCYDPQSQVCCDTSGALCAIGTYCSKDADGNTACCANGQNCQGSNAAATASPVTSAASSVSGTPASSTSAAPSATAASVTCSNGQSRCGGGCYDPTAFTCCSQGGVLCGINQYCSQNSQMDTVCCAIGFNCNGQGSSTAAASSATTVSQSGTATAASSSASTSAYS